MRGASRVSLAEARQRLSGAVTSAAVARTLGDELFAILEPARRAAGGAPGADRQHRPAEARRGLARTLLGGRVSDATLDLFTGMCASRWSVPGNLADAVEQLAVLAISAAAERGRHLDDLEDQLFRFGRVVASAPDLRSMLSNPQIPARYKQQLLGTLLEGKVTPDTLRLVDEAAVHPRGRSLDASLAEYAAAGGAVAAAADRGRAGGACSSPRASGSGWSARSRQRTGTRSIWMSSSIWACWVACPSRSGMNSSTAAW